MDLLRNVINHIKLTITNWYFPKIWFIMKKKFLTMFIKIISSQLYPKRIYKVK